MKSHIMMKYHDHHTSCSYDIGYIIDVYKMHIPEMDGGLSQNGRGVTPCG